MHRCSTAWRAVAPLLVVGLSLSACVTRPVQQAEPHWVRRGEGVFWDQAALYAVGVSNVGDAPTDARPSNVLKREADQRSRVQIATTLISYLNQLVKYAAEAGDTAVAEEMQAIHSAILAEGVVVHRWIDPFSQAVYALFRIDRRRIHGAMMAMWQRDEASRRRLAARADVIFERLRRQGEAWR